MMNLRQIPWEHLSKEPHIAVGLLVAGVISVGSDANQVPRW